MALNGKHEAGDRISIPKYLLDLMGIPVAEYGDPVACIIVKMNWYMGQLQGMTLKVEASGNIITLTAIESEKVLKAPVEA